MKTMTETTRWAVRVVKLAVQAHGGADNLAPLTKVREQLARVGLTTRLLQDAAIRCAQEAGVVCGAALEGRDGISPEEREASIPQRGCEGRIGYLMVIGGGR